MPELDLKDDKNKEYKINGVFLPWISFGTGVIWKYTRNKPLFVKTNIRALLSSAKHRKMNRELYGNLHINSILNNAYSAGFRLFDSARIYAYSETSIGKLVRQHDDIIITTKCSTMDVDRKLSPDTVEENMKISLKNLHKEIVEILLLHWPEGGRWIDCYRQIADLYKMGYCKIFGACNCQVAHLEKMKEEGLPLPMILQTEIHPLNIRRELRSYCNSNHIQLMAHTPTARMCREIQESSILGDISKKYNKSVAQVILRWHYQNSIIPVVNTFSRKHMDENLNIFDFQLSDKEMDSIDSLNCDRYFITAQGIDDPNYQYNF